MNEVLVFHNKILTGYGAFGKKSPLSNSYLCNFNYCHIDWNASETAIMWDKAIFFNDYEAAEAILRSSGPEEARRIGKTVKNFNDYAWKWRIKIKVPEILYEKFSQNEKLKYWLLNTGDARLAQIAKIDSDGNIIQCDRIWGIGIGPNHPDITDPSKWNQFGINFLGKTLIDIRNKLKSSNI